MKLGYSHGYQVPKCPKCNVYLHNPVESKSKLIWTFHCLGCDTYWEVTYVKEGRKYVLN